MEVKAFFNLLEKHHPDGKSLPVELKEALIKIIKTRSYRKKQLLLHEDHTPDFIAYVAKGSARVFHYSKAAEREITNWFWHEGELIISFKDFSKSPHGENIQLLEESTILFIHRKDLAPLFAIYPECWQIKAGILNKYKSRLYERTCDLISLTSQERYEKFFKDHKSLFANAYIRDIASFLNIHPVYLSRLRSGR